MHTHPHLLGDLATDRGRVRQAEATRERQLTQARGGAGGLRIARGPLATALVALAAVLIFVSTVGAAPQERTTAKVDAANYFVQHPGPAGGQSEFDPFDPYAPVGIGTGSALMTAGFTSGAGIADTWAAPPALAQPGQPS